MAFFIGNQEVSEAEWLKRNAAATGSQQVGTQRWMDSTTQLAQLKAAAAGTQIAQIPGVTSAPINPANLPTSYGGKTYKPVGAEVMFGAYKDPTTSQVVGEQFKAEGIYEKVGTYSATQDGVTTPGTLWKSSTGFYQFVDPSGQTIMSGSSGAPLPKLETLSAKEIEGLGKWKQWNNGIPTKPDVSASEALALPQKKEADSGMYPSDISTGVSTWKTPSTQESNPFDTGEDVFKRSYKPKSANVSATNQSESITSVKETPASGMAGILNKSNLFNSTQSLFKPKYKSYGEYRVYDDGTITDKSGKSISAEVTALKTPSTQESSPFDSGNDVFKYSYKPQTSSANISATNLSEAIPPAKEAPVFVKETPVSGMSGILNRTNLFNSSQSVFKPQYKSYGEYRLYDNGTITDKSGNKVSAETVTQIGSFGRKREMRRNKMHDCVKKNTGFAGLFHEAKEDVHKKPEHKNVAKSILWSGVTFGQKKKETSDTWAHFALEDKKISNTKKPVTKLVTQQKVKKDEYASAWEQILFSKKPKKAEKKHK